MTCLLVTCCILHNMCLDYDGFDDEWNLGGSTTEFNYGPDGLRFGDFQVGEDGRFTFDDDDHHRFYRCGMNFYDITPDIDYTLQGNLYCTPGTDEDKRNFISKRDRVVQNF